MPHPLLGIDTIDGDLGAYLHRIGAVFATFDRTAQSGNVSYGVQIEGERYFVKSAGKPDSSSCFSIDERLALLRTAIMLANEIDHPSMPRLLNVVNPSTDDPILVYDWVDGELLDVPREQRDDPASAYYRFRHLPADEITAALDAIFEIHALLADRQWVAVDFYDGSIMYDFERHRVTAIDLDCYHRGPFVNTMGEMFGSSRFKAPEESTLHAAIDQRTTVFTLGRFIAVFLSDGTLDRAPFRGSTEAFDVMTRACRPDPQDRYESVADFYAAWKAGAF